MGSVCTGSCGENQVWKDDKCVCTAKYAWYNGNCRVCPTGSIPNEDQSSCICESNSALYSSDKNLCISCPTGSQLNNARDGCECVQNYWRDPSG